ncbi:DUF1800 domain-containing protein [Primorskyibacter sp. S187A]|uniref:DUF1800 domain-containing protein n=1 Tax=Primorskyibacter sp. S187A TaxID=3415130 RepID=UPI003C7BD490
MTFDPHIAACRFGCGLSPSLAPPTSVNAMLLRLQGPDFIATRFPIDSFPEFRKRMIVNQELRKSARGIRNTPEGQKIIKQTRRNKGLARRASVGWFHMHLMRRTWTDDGFRERLAGFWADHFTTRGRAGIIKRGASPYVETAIRPRMTGLFEDLLIAAVTHPMMVDYLDQTRSIGENSKAAIRAKEKGIRKRSGINENLAREVLELHTLGVTGPFTQRDVRELAELMTGLTMRVEKGQVFIRNYAEPGPETVLGKSYGGDPAELGHIHDVLRDLARHPSTARHLCRKLAVHFVGDTPDTALTDSMAQTYVATNGHLLEVYRTMLSHPAAWAPTPRNVKPPFDFMSSALRALSVPPEPLAKLKEKHSRRIFLDPLHAMGHLWEKPAGPDGLYEADTDWITPQALAMRVQWALQVPQQLTDLPDPRQFVETALGARAPEAVRFAARASESVPDAIGLILMSPAFQRV